ncbi:hypothetical protein GLW20_07745 [Virgibacillus halodenitrificans]|nr:hypothetical protein [Virgibacillus halodenitrificans]
MPLLDHYSMEDMEKVLEHIENIMNASLSVLHAAEKADKDLAKNAQFQIEHSIKHIMAYNQKKIAREQIANEEYAKRHWF